MLSGSGQLRTRPRRCMRTCTGYGVVTLSAPDGSALPRRRLLVAPPSHAHGSMLSAGGAAAQNGPYTTRREKLSSSSGVLGLTTACTSPSLSLLSPSSERLTHSPKVAFEHMNRKPGSTADAMPGVPAPVDASARRAVSRRCLITELATRFW
eukprot:scaffold53067_cov69-Phaeocystis_antarctica.AAC.1